MNKYERIRKTRKNGVVIFLYTLLLGAMTSFSIAAYGAQAERPPAPVKTPGGLNIAYFPFGSSNTYLVAGNTSAKETAKSIGAKLTMFDPDFNPLRQVNQIKSALQTGKYNAMIIQPISGTLICKVVREAVAKGILVVLITTPACGRDKKNGVEQYEPGTITGVGFQSPSMWDQFAHCIVQDNPHGGKVVWLSGPAGTPLTTNTEAALKRAFKGKGFEWLAIKATDYTVNQGYQVTQAQLTAHPDANIIVSSYSDTTVGIVAAAKAAHRLAGLRIYDVGGNKQGQDFVADRTIRMTYLLPAKGINRLAVQELANYVEGKDVPKNIDVYHGEGLKLPETTACIWKRDVSEFTPYAY